MMGERAPVRLSADFPDTRRARDAVSTLEQRGVRGSSIKLVGQRRAAVQEARTAHRDERFLRFVGRNMMAGAALGALLGGIVGAAVGTVTAGLFTVGMWAATAGIAGMCAGVGFFLTVILRTPESEAGTAAVEESGDGRVTVEIEARDDDEVATAERAFRSTSASEVRRGG